MTPTERTGPTGSDGIRVMTGGVAIEDGRKLSNRLETTVSGPGQEQHSSSNRKGPHA